MKKYFSIFGLNLPVDSERRATAVDRRTSHLKSIKKSKDYEYGCDERGNITFIVDPNGMQTDYIYNDKNRLVEVLYPDATRQTFTYNEQGDILEIEDRNGERTTYHYDAFGRLLSAICPDESLVTFAYDDANRICFITAAGCDTRYYFNAAGLLIRVERVLESVTYITEYAYSDRGQCIKMRYPGNGVWLEYCYDKKNRIQSINVAGRKEICTFRYSEDSSVQVIFGNGVVTCYRMHPGLVNGEITTFSSDNAKEPLVSLQYRSDDAGRIVQVGDTRCCYDREDRIVEIQNKAGNQKNYTYDTFGNRLSETSKEGDTVYQYDKFSRLITQHCAKNGKIASRKYRYDGEGNLIDKMCDGKRTTYDYNGHDMLAKICIDGRVIAKYAYGPEGWRIKKDLGDDVTLYHHDQGGRVIAETDSKGKVKATFIWWGAQCLARIDGPIECGKIEYYHLDHVNTVQAVSDKNGNVCWNASCFPFGKMTPDDTYPYMGKWQDEETGLYYFGTRYYDPETGRFITPDTYTFAPNDPRLLANGFKDLWGCKKQSPIFPRQWLMEPQNLNPYVFCYNNPINFLDLDGHSAWWFLLTIPFGLSWGLTATAMGLVVYIGDLIFEFLNFFCAIGRLIIGKGFTAAWERMDWPDITASARLGVPWAFVGRGGLFVWRPYTLGCIFFVSRPDYAAYSGATPNEKMLIPKDPYVAPLNRLEALYAHEMQHVFQYTFCGIFFLVSPAILGFYIWDLLINGGQTNSSFERNAGANSGDVYKTLVEVEKDEIWAGEPILVVGVTPVAIGGTESITFVIDPTVPPEPSSFSLPRGSKTNVVVEGGTTTTVANGEVFYFRAPNSDPPVVKNYWVTGTAQGSSERVDIEVRPVEIDFPTEVYVCSKNLIILKEKDKSGVYSLENQIILKKKDKNGMYSIDFDSSGNNSGGEFDANHYYSGPTAGTDMLKLLVKYPGRKTINAAISDFGRDYEICKFDIIVKDIAVTVNPTTVSVGGKSKITIEGPELNRFQKVFAVVGSTYNRVKKEYTAGQGPITSDKTDKLRFIFKAGSKTCTKEISITVKPIVVTAVSLTVSKGGNTTASVSGGTPPYKYDITTNNSGGTIDKNAGTYTAGATAGMDTITVTDKNGGRGTIKITVT